MSIKNIIIAIDGYSSCGKSTLAKALAEKLKFVFVDSGAMYRAVTLYFLQNNTDLNSEEAVRKALKNIQIDMQPEGDQVRIYLNGLDITESLREMQVSEKVSEISANRLVREAMVTQQQKLGEKVNIVMDGRDIGTTVFPDADLKIFMTASTEVRVQRRYDELIGKGQNVTKDEIEKNLLHRDHIDTTREESPLRQASDAIVLDNSEMDKTQQLEFVLEALEIRRNNKFNL